MMASQTRTMAAWALAAMLLCAQFDVGESVTESILQQLKNKDSQINKKLSDEEKATKCDEECNKCGTKTDPLQYTVVIARTSYLGAYCFGTVIGKRLILTNEYNTWSRLYTPEKFSVFFLNNGRATKYMGHVMTAVEKSTKKNGDPIAVVVLNKDIPGHVEPACLPTSHLDTKLGMEFQVTDYQLEHRHFPLKFTNHNLKIIGEKDTEGRLLHLDDDWTTEHYGLYRAAIGGPALHKMNCRYIAYGLLRWFYPKGNDKRELRISMIDDDGVVKWIHKVAGDNCACEQPKAKVTPAIHGPRSTIHGHD